MPNLKLKRIPVPVLRSIRKQVRTAGLPQTIQLLYCSTDENRVAYRVPGIKGVSDMSLEKYRLLYV